MTEPYYSDDLVTLYHGDCREIIEWLAADMLVTDPPYGTRYAGMAERRKDPERNNRDMVGDHSTTMRDEALNLWAARGPALVFGSWKAPRPDRVTQLVIWDKRGGGGFSGWHKMPWADAAEEIYVLGYGWTGRRRPNIISIPSYNSQARTRPNHPTPKPVPLMTDLLGHCPPGVIADPFAGSGSTLLAARQLGRRVIGVEIEERYCALIAERLSEQAMTLDFAT